MAEEAVIGPVGPSAGFVGRIPVRNLWLLMLYASDLFRIRGQGKVGTEASSDEVADIVGEVLAAATEKRLRQRLTFGYRRQQDDLSRVRGKIDLLRTHRHSLLSRGLIACRFEALTVDTPRNRLVRAALERVARLAARSTVAHRCRVQAHDLEQMGVAAAISTRAQSSTERLGRHDAHDAEMLAAARLALDMAIPAESAGSQALPMPEREEVWARRLFERAVGGFYDVALRGTGWRVRTGTTLAWPVAALSAGMGEILPGMQTDIVLENRAQARRIVIDTKFTSIVTSGWHRTTTLRSGYLYQVYAYLRSQEGRGDVLADGAEGVLLHPSVGQSVDEAVILQGHRLRVATVDLAGSAESIRQDLLRICGEGPILLPQGVGAAPHGASA